MSDDAGPRLVGGEMTGWSDARRGEPARGRLLAHLLSVLPDTGRTLVAGPHDSALVTALPVRNVTCLLRSLPDATELARTGVEVLCGTLPKLDADGRYDTVVALDGLGRLCSVEGPQLDWADSLRALRGVLRPGGTLLLAVENHLGVHRLVEPSAMTGAHTDEDWNPVGELDASRPGSPNRLLALLAAEGLAVSWLGAGWPSPQAPALIATPDALALPGGPAGAMQAAASAAVAAAYGGRPVLSDPRRLASAAVRAGLGAELAPAWFVLAHRSPDPRTVVESSPVAGFPPVLLSDVVRGPVVEFDRDHDGRWVRRTVAEPDSTTQPTEPAVPVPVGRLLEERLLSACVRHDAATVRKLLSRYAGWLRTLDGGQTYATVDNVLVGDGDTFAVFDPGASPSSGPGPGRPGPSRPPAPVDVAVVRALRRFATTVMTGGYAHPWATAQDVDALTGLLCAAAGTPFDDDLHRAAVDLEVDVRSAVRPDADRGALLHEVRRPGLAAPVIDPRGWREREDHVRRLGARLSDAEARAEWCESELARREAQLRRARLQIAAFGTNPLYRLIRSAVAAARRLARSGIRR